MKKIIISLFLILCCCFLYAQTFTATFSGAAAAIPGTSTTQKCFPVTVSGVGPINDVTLGLASVCLNLTHPNDDELEIVLTAPDGTVVPLSIQNGGTGNNYNGTCFTATATQSIKFGTAPFAGTYLPEGHLGAVNNGQNANAVWNLCIQDRRTAGNAGSLTSYSLTFSPTPAPLPPALPACAYTLPGTSSCSNATSVCDFNGLCGTTSGTTVQDWAGSGLNGCFGLENNSFIKFIASGTTASFSVWVPTNTIAGNYNLGGIQMLFFSGTCNSGAVTTYGCYPHIFPYSAPGSPVVSVVSASGLTAGNTYYLMIDGFNSDHCTFTIAAISGVSFLNISPAAATICEGGNVTLTASGGNGLFSWSPAATLSASSGATVTATPTSTTTYTVSSTGLGSCAITKNVTVTVNTAPVINTQPASSVQNVCLNGTATTLNIGATAGSGSISGYQWYSNTTASNTGGILIPGATSATYTPPATPIGTHYYYCVITNSNTCKTTSAVSGAVIINPAIASPTAGTTSQPTCTTPTGTITITAPTGANIQYSVGGSYQASGTFTGLAPNTYNVTAMDIVTGCTSVAVIVTVNPVPAAPSIPTASVTLQPTCSVPTGTITITAPAGPNLQYSIGGIYQSSGIFTGLAPNTYTITVKDIVTGCVSASLPLTVNNLPGAPATATASVTVQPTCASPTGTIVITAPTGANIQYSIGGTYQASGIFTGLAANTYNITVKDIVTGCISTAMQLTINPPPGAPATPTASVTVQPICTTPTGTIVITAPTGANIQYSIGGVYQASGTFTGLAPNTYSITAKDMVTGCVSSVLSLTVNPVSAGPPLPTASVTVQPTCTTPTGTIVIMAPSGVNIQYSIGGAFQASGTFTTLAPNTYSVTVKDLLTGCISPVLSLTVNPVPAAPALPTASVTVQPTCSTPTGTITVTAPTGANLQYSIGGTYQASAIFTGLVPNTYNVTVKDIATGCMSPSLPLTVNVVPGAPAAPTASVTVQPTCAVPSGTIDITAPAGANIQYSIGGTFQASGTFTGLAPNTYTVTVKDIASGCISPGTILIVNAVPGLPSPPVTTPGTSCGTGTVTLTANGTGTLTWYSDAALTNQVATGASFNPVINSTTTYYVTATNNNCTSSATSVIATVNAIPLPDLGSDKSICQGDKLILNPGTFNSYLWQDNSILPTYNVTVSGTYTVAVKNTVGCQNTASVTISVLNDCDDIYFPAAFTPNGDNRNDEFGPLPLSSLPMVTNYELVVYNRYGQLVFHSKDPYKKWSGKFLEKIIAGNYAWYATYNFRGFSKVSKGNIMIIR